ncbi:zinc-binding metallopeptidase family protein [Candidatus Karelsulcia muelleri]|uniref:M42 family peptidase n=1 Tax=Candidatus Karelsulcia muelleri TaxID=336810 RepID=UPI000D7CBE02|nr:M42 family peptidase [Candidatus Karelsulcia muelleri]
MYKICKKSEFFLYKYLYASSLVEEEVSSPRIWKNYIEQYSDSIETDNYGTVIGIINKYNSFKIVIEAHVEARQWYINYISDDGIIYVACVDKKIAPSKRVNIHTKNGIIDGVFFYKISEKLVNFFFIDIGASTLKEVENLGINVGCRVTSQYDFFILNNKYYVGSAHKICGFIIAEVMRLIKKNNVLLPYGLYVINTVRKKETPPANIVIKIDVCNETYPLMRNKKINGEIKCGLGPVINYSPSINNNLREKIIFLAKKNNLSFQRLVNNQDYFSRGIYALISIPIRYRYTTVEMALKKDIENCINIMYETLKNIDPSEKFNYF